MKNIIIFQNGTCVINPLFIEIKFKLNCRLNCE